MAVQTLLMRIGMHEPDPSQAPGNDVTEQERLPMVVEVGFGVGISGGTRMTEVARETTDDN